MRGPVKSLSARQLGLAELWSWGVVELRSWELRSWELRSWELWSCGLGPPRAPVERDLQMAGPAEQPIVLESALAAAVGDRDDVVRFPARARRAPGLSGRAIGRGRLRARPLAMGLDDVEAAEPADALVAFLHFAAHVPGAAADLPLVDAGVAAEGPPRRRDWSPAPPADRPPGLVPLGFPPLIGRHDPRAPSAHAPLIGGTGRGA